MRVQPCVNLFCLSVGSEKSRFCLFSSYCISPHHAKLQTILRKQQHWIFISFTQMKFVPLSKNQFRFPCQFQQKAFILLPGSFNFTWKLMFLWISICQSNGVVQYHQFSIEVSYRSSNFIRLHNSFNYEKVSSESWSTIQFHQA